MHVRRHGRLPHASWTCSANSCHQLDIARTFEKASTVFADPLSVTIYDPVHSEDDDRYFTLGESQRRRVLDGGVHGSG